MTGFCVDVLFLYCLCLCKKSIIVKDVYEWHLRNVFGYRSFKHIASLAFHLSIAIKPIINDGILFHFYTTIGKYRSLYEAIFFLLQAAQLVVEGSGAVGVAALLSGKVDLKGKKVAVILSGGNIDMAILIQIMGQRGLGVALAECPGV